MHNGLQLWLMGSSYRYNILWQTGPLHYTALSLTPLLKNTMMRVRQDRLIIGLQANTVVSMPFGCLFIMYIQAINNILTYAEENTKCFIYQYVLIRLSSDFWKSSTSSGYFRSIFRSILKSSISTINYHLKFNFKLLQVLHVPKHTHQSHTIKHIFLDMT